MVYKDKLILFCVYKFGLLLVNLLWNYIVLKDYIEILFNFFIRSRK